MRFVPQVHWPKQESKPPKSSYKFYQAPVCLNRAGCLICKASTPFSVETEESELMARWKATDGGQRQQRGFVEAALGALLVLRGLNGSPLAGGACEGWLVFKVIYPMKNSEKHLKTVGGILSKRGKLSASEPVGCNWVGDTRVMQAQGFALFGGFSSHTGSLGTLCNTMEHHGTLWWWQAILLEERTDFVDWLQRLFLKVCWCCAGAKCRMRTWDPGHSLMVNPSHHMNTPINSQKNMKHHGTPNHPKIQKRWVFSQYLAGSSQES